MCHQETNLQIRNKKYESKGKESIEIKTTQLLHIQKPTNDAMPKIPKGVLKKSMYNPNACDA